MAADFARRLRTALQPTPSGGLGKLRQLHAEQVQRRATEWRDLTAAEPEEQRRRSLTDAARQGFQRISDNVRLSLANEVPDAPITARQQPGGWERSGKHG